MVVMEMTRCGKEAGRVLLSSAAGTFWLYSGQLRKRKFTYGKSLFAQIQTSEQQPRAAA
jgi:hypothetical protein